MKEKDLSVLLQDQKDKVLELENKIKSIREILYNSMDPEEIACIVFNDLELEHWQDYYYTFQRI